MAQCEEARVDGEEFIELQVVTAYVAAGKDVGDEKIAQECADMAQNELACYYSREQAKKSGLLAFQERQTAFRPKSELTLEERRTKLALAKKNSKCKKCKKYGHWAGDPECSFSKGTTLANNDRSKNRGI